MNSDKPKTYWTSIKQRDRKATQRDGNATQRDGNRPVEHDALPETKESLSRYALSRRRFLEAAGFSLSIAALSGCSREPVSYAMPLDALPEGMRPGRMRYYASAGAGCFSECGLLIGVRDGRPLKIEGMPEHPLSRGGLNAVAQAMPIELYDSQRLKTPLAEGKASDWATVDKAILEKIKTLQKEGAVRFVTSTITSPTLQTQIDAFLKQFKDAKHITFDAVSSSAILDAHAATHGARVLPHYLLDNAKTIVSFGADFLGTWISPVEFTAAWRVNRTPTEEHPEMSYHAHFEGRMSLTGSKADKRFRLAPDEHAAVLSQLLSKVAKLAGSSSLLKPAKHSPISDEELTKLAERLWKSKGESIVLCDSQDIDAQTIVNFINHLLGNYGETLDIVKPSRQRQGNDREVLELLDELNAGTVAALFVAGTDLSHNLPNEVAFTKAIKNVSLVVSFAERNNATAALSHFVCPDHHLLESWSDSEPIDGLVGLGQPTIAPLGKTRSILESLSKWMGRNESAYGILRDSWKKNILSRAKSTSFGKFWDQAVHDGFVEVSPRKTKTTEFKADAVVLSEASQPSEKLVLSLYSKVGMPDSKHAHNPWLQELPDPITKVVWDNYVCVSPATAKKLSLANGDLVSVEIDSKTSIELPAFVQPGQHDRVLAIALAYGCKGTERFAKIGPQWFEAKPTVEPGGLVGKNAALYIEASKGTFQYTRAGVTIKKISGRRELATTQEYNSIDMPENIAKYVREKREVVQETTLAAFIKDPHAGAPPVHAESDEQLWPEDHVKTGHAWGMIIDTNTCTGCSGCVIACQSENNIPVVGWDEVCRQRDMQWMRIDRYYTGEDDDVDVLYQPMMCQHCDNAPCETVCPALATTHSDEGLNEQVYNRCVGTRYCANNCPYKVRRFNWFLYPHDDAMQNLALNPDVTVRSRGVMEKCSMCVQRIEAGKINAKRTGEPLTDGTIQTACQQSCPAQAIIFGDMNDPESAVSKALENPRRYRVLEEFNFRPGVAYQRIIRNREEEPKTNKAQEEKSH